ncbi:hypothetical protein NC652_033418 [Populus alba x Populus x berolinensis]|uniref:Uncharacterized protein n=1 Tax=Populus alba x Populus x berolinensis TaxID=444605 RepID=A0AAD6LUQ4_9ROSI|nr:hypothetical protein NC652_033418 [Populus alba x Populus x berolinensis]KAJ6973019.1 hypothetical protein NC653_033376 [Populus alba x Populus x berolinensis]
MEIGDILVLSIQSLSNHAQNRQFPKPALQCHKIC